MSTFTGNNVSSNDIIYAADHNTLVALVAEVLNGGLDNTNINAAAAIDGSKLADTSIATAKLANAAVTTEKQTAVTYVGTGSSIGVTTSDQVVASQVLPTYAASHKFLILLNLVYTHSAGAATRDYTVGIKNGTTLLRDSSSTSEASTYVRTVPVSVIFTSSGGETINFTIRRSTDNGGTTVTSTHYTIVDLGRA